MHKVSDEVHRQRQQLLLEIAGKYTDPDGKIRVKQAFIANPQYRSQLASLGLDTDWRVNAYVLHMRRSSLLPNNGITKDAKFGKRPKHRVFRPDADVALIHHINRTYGETGGVQRWHRAFGEHPDWAKRIGYPGKKAMSFVYRSLKRKDPGGAFGPEEKPAAPVAPVVVPEPQAADTSEPAVKCPLCKFVSQEGRNRWAHMTQHLLDKHVQPPEAALPFNYCPKCGSNLLMFVTAFKVASKHSQNGGHE